MVYKTLVTKLNRKEQNMNIQKQVTIKKTPKEIALQIWDGQTTAEPDTYSKAEVIAIYLLTRKDHYTFSRVIDELEGLKRWGDEEGYVK